MQEFSATPVTDTIGKEYAPTPAQGKGPIRIVVVNDEPFLLEMYDMILRDYLKDVTVLSFANGATALEELSRTDPDLLITDDAMPVMHGGELCERLWARGICYPVIVNSGLSHTEEWVRDLGNRGLDISFLPVPFGMNELRGALARYFDLAKQPEPQQTATPRPNHSNGFINFLRWIAFVPLSIAAYIAIQFVVAFANSLIPLPAIIIDTFCQFANSIVGPLALIHVSVKVAPSHKIGVSVVMASLFVLASLGIGIVWSFGHRFSLAFIWFWVCIIIGMLAALSYCLMFHEDTMKAREKNL